MPDGQDEHQSDDTGLLRGYSQSPSRPHVPSRARLQGGAVPVMRDDAMGPSIAIVDVQRILARSVVGQLARELVQEYQDAETRQEREQDLLSFVLQGVAKIVQELGAELGVSVIVERQRAGILYAASDADLTTRVLQIYDERYAKID